MHSTAADDMEDIIKASDDEQEENSLQTDDQGEEVDWEDTKEEQEDDVPCVEKKECWGDSCGETPCSESSSPDSSPREESKTTTESDTPASPATESVDISKYCKYFNSRRGCRNGNTCRFLHERLTCAFFASPQGCTFGNNCSFNHVEGGPLSAVLKKCPTWGCEFMCAGRQCIQCHQKMISETPNEYTKTIRTYPKNKYGHTRERSSPYERKTSRQTDSRRPADKRHYPEDRPNRKAYEKYDNNSEVENRRQRTQKKIKLCANMKCNNTTCEEVCSDCCRR